MSKTTMIGGREWKRSRFNARFGRDGNISTVTGLKCGRYGMFEVHQIVGLPWAYLFDLKYGGGLLGIFEGLHAAAVASQIEEALDSWPTYINELDGRSFRDEAFWHSGFRKGGSFCYENTLPVWWLEDGDVLKPAHQEAA